MQHKIVFQQNSKKEKCSLSSLCQTKHKLMVWLICSFFWPEDSISYMLTLFNSIDLICLLTTNFSWCKYSMSCTYSKINDLIVPYDLVGWPLYMDDPKNVYFSKCLTYLRKKKKKKKHKIMYCVNMAWQPCHGMLSWIKDLFGITILKIGILKRVIWKSNF